MSEEPQDKNRNKPLSGGSSYKTFIVWGLVIFSMIAMLYMMENGAYQNTAKLSIHNVITDVQSDSPSIIKGVLKPSPQGGRNWHEISGTMRTANGSEQTFVASGQLTDDNLDILQRSGRFSEEPASTLLRDFLVSVLPFAIIFALIYFVFVRQLRNAGRGAMSFGKSKARMLTQNKDRASFKDVAGCDEAKEEVAEVVEFLKDPKKFQNVGGRIPKGVLLVGPPGTGKTLLARAVAGEADVPFFTISGSDFVEMFVGVGAARVRDMFEQGRKSAPCIIFIDEIDAVGRQRGAGLGGGNDEREQTLNSLLVEMDGFDGHEGVIIMAATNRPDVLDSALLRPGRFDRSITIDLPDMKGREEILRVHAKKIKLAKGVDLGKIAGGTTGFSGADLANLLNEAALLAARYGATEVHRQHIDEARDKIAYGRERRKLMDDEDKRMTAFHEAGHALVQAVIGDRKFRLHKVTIIPRGRALGMTMFAPTKDILGYSKKELLNNICMAMGGRIGEEVETGDYSNGAAGDIKQATKIARHMVCDWGMSDLGPIALGENQEQLFLAREITRTQNYSEETAAKIDESISRIVKEQYERATGIIREHHDALRKIAEALLQYETIDGVHVLEILEHGEVRTPVVSVYGDSDADKDEKKSESAPSGKKKQGGEDTGLGSASPALA